MREVFSKLKRSEESPGICAVPSNVAADFRQGAAFGADEQPPGRCAELQGLAAIRALEMRGDTTRGNSTRPTRLPSPPCAAKPNKCGPGAKARNHGPTLYRGADYWTKNRLHAKFAMKKLT